MPRFWFSSCLVLFQCMCVFLKPLEKVYKVRKRCGLLVETLISYYQLVTVSLCPDQVFPLADTSVNPSSSVWFTSSQNPKPFNTFCVSFKNDALQKTPRGRKWQVYQMIYWPTSWQAQSWSN